MAHSTEAIGALQKFVAQINAHDPTGIIVLSTVDHVFIDGLGLRLSGRGRLEQAWTGRSDTSAFSGLPPIEPSDQTEKFVVERFHPSGRAASKY